MKPRSTLATAVLWVCLVTPGGVAAQVGARAGEGVEAPATDDSIRCWWKSGKSAVYLGERFPLTLTCRLPETAALRVAVEEAGLDPAAVQLPPFDVVDGTRYSDISGDSHRLFQYQYSLRVIADGLFGREIGIPPLDIRYRVLRASDQRPAVEGPERLYRLPALPLRVMTLSSTQAVDIRDAPADTFGDIQSRRLRGSIALATAALLFSAALGCVAVAAGGAMRRHRAPAPQARRLSEDRILDGAIRELERLRRQVDDDGWNPDAIGQALAASRVGMAIAMGQRPPQTVLEGDGAGGQEGTLIVHHGLIRPRRLLVSASVTPESATAATPPRAAASQHGEANQFQELRAALTALTAARYGRDEQVTPAALDDALGGALAVLRRTRATRSWRVTGPAALRRAIARRRPWRR